MATYDRTGVTPTETIIFRVLFTDDTGELVSLDSVPSVYIYDESVATATLEAEILARVFTSALSGPHVPTLITTGFYEYSYTVPSGSDEGTWHDVWVGDLDSVVSDKYFDFVVEVGAVGSTQGLAINEFVVVDLDSTIADDDDGTTLGTDVALSFTTAYNPYYASVEMVRMEVGPWIDFIPDDTLAMFIHWSSEEAKAIATCPGRGKLWNVAKQRFVMFDAALRAVMLPNANQGAAGGQQKALGDLSIKNSGAASGVPVLSSGVDFETISWIRHERDEWWRVVNAGGNIVPGESLGSEYAVKGLYDPDRRRAGRGWDDPRAYSYPQSGGNIKHVRSGRRRYSFFFKKYRNN